MQPVEDSLCWLPCYASCRTAHCDPGRIAGCCLLFVHMQGSAALCMSVMCHAVLCCALLQVPVCAQRSAEGRSHARRQDAGTAGPPCCPSNPALTSNHSTANHSGCGTSAFRSGTSTSHRSSRTNSSSSRCRVTGSAPCSAGKAPGSCHESTGKPVGWSSRQRLPGLHRRLYCSGSTVWQVSGQRFEALCCPWQ